jgi:hypothetical protein
MGGHRYWIAESTKDALTMVGRRKSDGKKEANAFFSGSVRIVCVAQETLRHVTR